MDIGEFYDVQVIGHGGMGTVYEGFFRGQKVAIKEFKRDFLSEADLIERFRLEARVIDKLHHPAIVKIVKPSHYKDRTYYPAFEENGNLYLAMEFVEGLTLEQYVKQFYPNGIPESEAIEIMCRILEAMEYVRQQKLVHRDIKPSNIIVKPDKSICILDFGIAKDIASTGLTTGRCILGTSGYMSPEQAEGGLTVDYRTDIYSLGCVFFYMLTGVHAIPKKGSEMETRIAVLRDSFPRLIDINPALSEKVQAVIDKAVEKNMLLRYQSPEEFRQALLSENSTQFNRATSSLSTNKITVGRDRSCDLFVNDTQEKVSRRHMDISWEVVSGGILYVFVDRSTNGSMVNERFIHGESCSLLDKKTNRGSDAFSPSIILAGTVLLDWNDVKEIIDKKIKSATSNTHSGREVKENVSESIITRSDSLSTGEFLLCVIFPFIGFIWSHKFKEAFQNKARSSALAGWLGVCMYILFAIIVVLATR